MARRVNYQSLRMLILRGSIDHLHALIDVANDLEIAPGERPLSPLTPEESLLPVGSANVRSFVEWLQDYDEDDELVVRSALASISERLPGMLKMDPVSEPVRNGQVVPDQDDSPVEEEEPKVAAVPPTIGKKEMVKRDRRRAPSE